MKILVTGANGFLGSNIVSYFINKGYEVVKLVHENCDLVTGVGLDKYFETSYDSIIHCASVGGRRTKLDDASVISQNILMFDNLANKRNYYDRFIYFGSGVQYDAKLSREPYGISKRYVSHAIENMSGFYNINIWNIFGPTEQSDRFIRANIQRYINHEPIIIHANKEMDFFYVEDFLELSFVFATWVNPPKSINAVYKQKISLIDIANIINTLSNYQVPIKLESESSLPNYTGYYNNTMIQTYGLEVGLKKVYKYLKENK